MLEKLITNFKNSLPEPIRKKLGMGEENEEQEQDQEDESDADDHNREDSNDNAPDADASEKRKKQISMAMRVGLILVVAYLAIDEFVLKKGKSEPSVDEMLASMPVKKTKPKKEAAVDPNVKAADATTAVPDATATAETTTPTPETASIDIPPDTASTDASSMEIPPIENVNILDKNGPEVTTSPEAQLQIETPATEPPATETPEVVTETKVIDTSVDKKIDQLVDNVDQSTTTAEEVKIPSQPEARPQIKAPSEQASMASKIVEVATETPAPAYDQVGRGLVYNCKDKYWACVDKPAYLLCNRNMKWNDSKGNAKECVVQNIYNSDEDCAKVQKYNVTMSISTSFCQ